MKNATEHARHLAALLKRLPAPQPPPLEDDSPLARLIVGFLQWNASQRAAHAAFRKILAAMVDYNDLRVSRPSDIVSLLGPRYPLAEERAARLRDTLQAIYVREHATSLDALRGRSAKDLRQYLESLPGITPFVVAYTLLWGFQQPALPVDDRLAELLTARRIVEPQASRAEVQAFLERHVKHDDMLRAYLALAHWADHQSTAAPRKPPAPRPARSAGRAKVKRPASSCKGSKRPSR